MSTGIIDTIKKVALNVYETTSPVAVFLGEVLSTNPIAIKLNDFTTLTEEFLVINGEVNVGDKVTLLRVQGGQQFVVLGLRTGYVENTVYVGGETLAKSDGSWQYPFKSGYTKTSDFGWRRFRGEDNYHTGVDLCGINSKHIYPVNNGTVVFTKELTTGYGKHILINHGDGIWSLYAHLSKIYVKAGQAVNKDTILGVEGSTGNSTGSHLHLEIRKRENGSYVNPVTFLANHRS